MTTTEVKPTLSVDVLEQAKEALRTHGWTKGTMISCETGEVCALGAVAVALGVEVVKHEGRAAPYRYEVRYPWSDAVPTLEEQERISALRDVGEHAAAAQATKEAWRRYDEAEERYLEQSADYAGLLARALTRAYGVSRFVPSWNDYVATSVDEVIAVFDAAIEILQEESK